MNRCNARLLAGLFFWAAGTAAAMPAAPMEKACELLGNRLQSVSVQACLAAKLRDSGIVSVHGQPLLYRDFLPKSKRSTPYRVLLMGGIHGDELSSVSLVFQWMRQIETERFQPFHWRVMPCVNPDGLLANPPTRVNANGVDLNRNFPSSDWNSQALKYWKTRTGRDPRRYPGVSALSEPESRGLTEMIRSFHPDVIVSVHAPYGVLDYDGPEKAPERFGYLHLQLLGTYPGSLGNFAGLNLSLPIITLELPHAGLMPTPTQTQRIWTDMLTWMEKNLPKYPAPLYMRLDSQDWRGG